MTQSATAACARCWTIEQNDVDRFGDDQRRGTPSATPAATASHSLVCSGDV
jgi:hypothetical protein